MLNILDIFVVLDTSHFEMSPLKDSTFWNRFDISVTSDTSHLGCFGAASSNRSSGFLRAACENFKIHHMVLLVRYKSYTSGSCSSPTCSFIHASMRRFCSSER